MTQHQTCLVERLPDDILYEIFRYLSRVRTELIRISHCCRRWRLVVLGSSMLWTQISLTQTGQLDWLAAHVDRSQNSKLDVCIHLWPFYNSKDVEFDEWMDALEPHAYRWGALCVSYLTSQRVNRLLSHHHYPQLTSLSVDVDCEAHDDTMDILQAGVERMPVLRELICKGKNAGVLRADRSTWWSSPLLQVGLRKLELHPYPASKTVTVDACLGVLQRCPYLEELALWFDLDHALLPPFSELARLNEYRSQEGNLVIASHLKRLDLAELDYPLVCFLARIHAPRVRHNDWAVAHSLLPHLASMKPFPYPLLEDLRVCASGSATSASSTELGELISILIQLPELRSLRVEDIAFGMSGNGPSHLMTFLETSCPKLKTFILERWSGGGEVVQALQKLVKARRASEGLQDILSLEIFWSRIYFTAETLEWFDANVEKFYWNKTEHGLS